MCGRSNLASVVGLPGKDMVDGGCSRFVETRLLHVVLKRPVRPGVLKKLVPSLPKLEGELVSF